MRRSSMRWFAVPVVTVLLGACGSDGDSSSPTAASAGSVASTTSEASTVSEAGTDETAAPTAAPATDDTMPSEASVAVSVAEVESDAVSSGGEQPTLSWPAVEGAALYSVVVADAEGVSFWGWQGTDLSVTVGDGAPDPLVSSDMTWSAVALDAEGAPLWDSGPVPV
jgi:hypothetical protein